MSYFFTYKEMLSIAAQSITGHLWDKEQRTLHIYANDHGFSRTHTLTFTSVSEGNLEVKYLYEVLEALHKAQERQPSSPQPALWSDGHGLTLRMDRLDAISLSDGSPRDRATINYCIAGTWTPRLYPSEEVCAAVRKSIPWHP